MQVAPQLEQARVSGDGATSRPSSDALAALATLLAIVLLFVGAWADGAFALRTWGPLAVFTLVALAAGRRNAVRGPAVLAVVAIFAFGAWTLLSVTWADAPSRAVEGAGRTLLYASLFVLPLVTLPSRRAAVLAAQLIAAGSALLVLGTLIGCWTQGVDRFLAGRLNEPIGYRNGTAALFALAFWPLLCVAAQRHVHALLRAGCFSLAVAALGLAFLTQSRGVLLGFCAGALVALLMGPDRIRRAWLTIFAVGAVAVVSQQLLAPYDAFVAAGSGTSEAAVDEAVRALALLTAVSFFASLLVVIADGGLRLSERHLHRLRTAAVGALVLLSLAAVAGGIAVVGDPISFASDKAREFRDVDTGAAAGETRLGTTGGQRYDLWRIALDQFRSAPLTGVGESSYQVGYYASRATDRNLWTPHSLPLRVLAETGLVGALLLLLALGSAFVAIVRGWSRTRLQERRWASAAAAGSAVVIGQASVDWLWFIPGLMGLAIMGAGVAVAIVALPPEAPPQSAFPSRIWTAARAVPAAAAVALALLVVADLQTRSARASTSPEARLETARSAQTFNPFALAPRYLQASALEDLGRRREARRELEAALEREPRNFVTLGLLGDLEMRAGNRQAARDYYRSALALNPRDTGLQELAG